jgi:hypothetical protein
MPFVTVGKENSSDINIDIDIEDHGAGQPGVLIH